VTAAAQAAPPVANNDIFNVNEGGTLSGQNVLVNDTDPDNDIVRANLVSGPSDAVTFALLPNGNFLYIHNGDESPTDSFTYEAEDAEGNTDTAGVTIIVAPVNDQPEITGQDPISTPEDTAVTIVVGDLVIDDPDNDFPGDFTLSVQDGANYTRVGNTITPVLNYTDPLTVPVTVTDNSGAGNAQSPVFDLTVTIIPQNDTPVLVSPIGDRTATEDQLLNLNVSGNFSDPDDDPLTFGATGLPPGFAITSGGLIFGTADDADVGSYSVTVTAEDPDEAAASDNFTLTVLNINDQPVITGQDPVSTLEDTPVTVLLTNLFVSDPDNAFPADFTLTVQDGANYTRIGNTITPVQDFTDPLSVPLTVSDNSGEANAQSEVFNLTVTITPQNDPPFLVAPIGDRQFLEDSPVNADFSGFFDDPDGDTLSFSATGLPAGLSISPAGLVTGTATQDDVGVYNVTVTATDPSNASASDSLQLEIVNVNDAPVVLAPIGNQQTPEDSPFSLNVAGNFDDEDGDALSFSASGLPPSLTISQAGLITGTPTQADVGVYSVTVTATDPSDASVDAPFSLEVTNVNDQPVITGQASLVTPEDTPLTIQLTDLVVEDPDNVYPDDFTLTVFNGSNYTVSGTTITPAAEFSGQLDVPVRVNDGAANSPVFILAVTVTAQNDAPVIVGQNPDPLVVDEDQPLTIVIDNLLVEDPDNDFPDDFTLAVLPGDDYSIVSGTTIQPAPDFAGALAVDVTTSDGDATSPIFSLAVSVTPVNDPPLIVGQNVLQTDEETALTITIDDLIVDDPDDPPENLTLEVLDGENYARVGNTITPALDFVGALAVPAQVSDGQSTSDIFVLTVSVASVDDRPVIVDQLPLSTPEETPLEITLADLIVSDPDSLYPDDFTLAVFPGPNYSVSDTTITPDDGFNGELTVTIIVNDGVVDSEPFDLLVTVTPVNDPPVIIGQQPLSTAEDTPITLTVNDLIIEDSDNVFPTDFTLTVQTGANYTVAGTTVTPVPDYLGELNVTVTVSDGLDTSAPFVVDITVTPVNDAPVVVAPIPDQNSFEDEFFTLDVSGFFSDADPGDTLEFSASGLPASGNLSIDPQTGVIAGTPELEDTRDVAYNVTVTATDGAGAFASDTFGLFVFAKDRADVALSIDVTPSPALLGEEVRWTVTVTNAGPANVTGLRLSGSLIGAALSVGNVGQTDCTIGTPSGDATGFDCTLGDLARGGTAITVVATTTDVPGDVVAIAEVELTAALPIDPNTANNAQQRSVSFAQTLSNGAVQALGAAGVLSLAQGDVDGDGDPDLVLGTVAGRSTEVYLGSGSRVFIEPPGTVPNNSAAEGVALADFDGDDDLDLLIASAGGQSDQVFVNDGSGIFAALTSLPASDSRGVAVGDFNDDGSPDIALAETGANSVYLNDGAGGFSLLADLGNRLSLDVGVADFDGDGLPDLVFANQGAPSTVYLNDGSGFANPISLNIGDATSVAIADLDGDGRPDLAFGRVPRSVGDLPANPVLLNDGAGQFTGDQQLGASPTLDVVAADTDGDGWTDLVFVNETGTHQIWRGSATGFTLYREQIVAADARAAAAGDLGNDGGADVALGVAAPGGALLFLNDGLGNLGLGDAVPPVLSLLGQASVSVPAGSTYQDAGATAVDNIDGDLTADILVDSNVNTSLVGTYRVTYNVTDRAGNKAAPITRTVQVTPAAGTGGGGGGVADLWLAILLICGLVAGRARPPRGTI
jgi:hypothetical protein